MNREKPTDPEMCRELVQLFLHYMDSIAGEPAIYERPENQLLLDALREVAPDARPNGLLAKMLIVYADGILDGLSLYDEDENTPN